MTKITIWFIIPVDYGHSVPPPPPVQYTGKFIIEPKTLKHIFQKNAIEFEQRDTSNE